jgi:hypothetical protein
MRVAADRARLVLVLIAAASFAACKVVPRSQTALVDDLDQIEAELRNSDERLAEAGVVVAYREPTTARDYAAPTEAPPAEETPPAPPPDEPTTLEPGSEPPAPTTEPPPEAPVSAPDAEEDDAPALSGRASKQSVQRERDSKRRRSERKRVHKASRTRCERVCELSETTCELQARVCGLASEHPDDVRYEDACRRAEDQCEAATRSCETCAV